MGFRVEHIPWYILRVNKYRVSMIFTIMVVTILISAAIIFKWSSPMADHYWDFIYRPILGSGNDTFIPRNIFKYVVYFLAIVFPFYYNSYDIEIIRNVAKKMFYFFCFIAVIEKLGMFYYFTDFISTYLISRFGATDIGGRVWLIETEPARAANLFLMTYLIAFWGKFEIRPLIYLVIITVVFIQSTTGVFILLLVLPVVYSSGKRSSIILLSVFTFTALSMLYYSMIFHPGAKVSRVASLFFQAISGSKENWDNLVDYVLLTGGFRVINLLNTLLEISIVPSFNNNLMNTSLQSTPVSYILYHVYSLGFLSLFAFLSFIYIKHNRTFIPLIFSRGFIVFLIIGLLYSSPGSGLLSIFLMVLIFHLKNNAFKYAKQIN